MCPTQVSRLFYSFFERVKPVKPGAILALSLSRVRLVACSQSYAERVLPAAARGQRDVVHSFPRCRSVRNTQKLGDGGYFARFLLSLLSVDGQIFHASVLQPLALLDIRFTRLSCTESMRCSVYKNCKYALL